MVLSRKKLKQRLRSLLAAAPPESDDAAVAAAASVEAAEREVESIRERLGSSKRPRPKRKRRKQPDAEAAAGEAEEAEAEEKQTEEKKAKKEKKSKKPKKQKKKEKKKKKKSRKEEEKEGVVAGDGVDLQESNGDETLVVGSNDSIELVDSEQNLKKVYVGGIPYYSTEDDIRSFFVGCGTVTEVDCMMFPETGKFRGIAILTFKTEAAAKRALALDGADMGGFYLKIQPYKTIRAEKSDFAPQMIEGYNRIYAGNLSWDVTEDDLKKLFSDCKISSIRFGTGKETGDFKGYAHVDFSDSTSLALALKLDQKMVCGRPVRIRCAVPKKDGRTNPVSSSDDKKGSGNEGSESSRKKRRTCYECGTPGHLSSCCPNKRTAEVVGSDDQKASDNANSGSSMKKRRTCYECGTPGHLSSSCPNKKTAEVVSSDDKVRADNEKTRYDPNTGPSKKKKRRTCYECGIPGHLSSDCPNKRTALVK